MKLQIVNMILNLIIIAEITYSCILAHQNRKLTEELKAIMAKNRQIMEAIMAKNRQIMEDIIVGLMELRAKIREIECQDE